jgi:hypothetical protein
MASADVWLGRGPDLKRLPAVVFRSITVEADATLITNIRVGK